MPVICSFYGILIRMYFGDHNPPHFHAQYGAFNAIFAINDLAILEGSLPPKATALVVEWALIHRTELEQNWIELSEKKTGEFIKIEPLK